MKDKRTTYCYVPDGLDKLELAILKARIKTYYPEVILLLVNDLGDFRGRFPSGLLNDSFRIHVGSVMKFFGDINANVNVHKNRLPF